LAAAAIAGAALACYNPASAGAEPVKLRMGWVVVPADIHPLIPELPRGVTVHLGHSYVFDAVHFDAAATQVTAMAAGDIDLCSIPYPAVGAALRNAGMEDLRIIADGFQDGAPGYYTGEYMVRNDAGIRAIEDLRGKVLATSGQGGAQDIALRVALRQHELEDKRDVTIVESRFPNMKAMLLDGKVDLVGVLPPFSRDPELRAKAQTLFTMRDIVGTTQMVVWTGRKGFVEKHRAEVVDFLEDALRALHWMSDPANADAVAEIAARVGKQPAERFRGWIVSKEDFYRNPDGVPDLAALQRNVVTMKEVGFLKSAPDVAKYADLTLIEEARSRLH
jgi:NitT/TauT family transport system substrate-binding protein